MSERDEHNELIHRLAERLRDHVEPYRDGAWERYVSIHGKRRRKLWPYWSGAAALLAVVGLYWSTSHSGETPTPRQAAQQDAVLQPMEVPEYLGGVIDAEAETTGDRAVPSARNPSKEVEQHSKTAQLPITIPMVAHEETPVDDPGADRSLVNQPPVLAISDAVDTAVTTEPEPSRLAAAAELEETEQLIADAQPYAVLEAEGTNPEVYAVVPSKTDREVEKWDVGVVMSPSLTSEAVNIGGGFAVAYRISDKFSIGSGVSIAQLGVGENPGYQPQYSVAPDSPTPSDYFNGQSELAVSYRREVSMTSSVVTLDIPLDLRYHVAKGFYTSVGLSYVAVLDEQRTGHYVDRLNKNTFVNGQSPTADRLSSTEFVYSSERIAAKPLRGNGYAGYMNFSIGKRLSLSPKLFLSVEPYFKLPVGRLSKEELNFTNGGIRIVTGF